MADEKKNPWPMVIFFGIALTLLWLLIDTLKPPASAKAAVAAEEEATKAASDVTPAATPEAVATEVPAAAASN